MLRLLSASLAALKELSDPTSAQEALPPRKELLDLYKSAVEEYRFQVKLNADRSRDYFVGNSAIIAAGVTLLGQAKLPLLSGGAFVIGVVVSILSMFGTHTQHGYYRSTRDRMRALEDQLGYTSRGLELVEVTPSGSRFRRFGKVTTFNYVTLALLCAINVMGATWSFWRVGHPEPGQAAAAVTAPRTATTPGPGVPTAPALGGQSRAIPRRP